MEKINGDKAGTLVLGALIATLVFSISVFTAGCGAITSTTETQTRTTIPPDVQGDAASSHPSISADGRLVAFRSDATNLVVGSTNGAHSIYVKDKETGVTTRASTASDGANGNRDSDNPVISADGRFVAFDSTATNLAAGDANNDCLSAAGTNTNCPDVFIKNLNSGETRIVSASTAGAQGNRDSDHPAISGDGRYVAFRSSAANLVTGDGNGKSDIFLKDMQSGAVSRVSVAADGTESNGDCAQPSISTDGRFVAFLSDATDLAPDDTNGKIDVYVKDIQTGALTRVSVGAGGQGNEASGLGSLAISASGRFVAFDSAADNLVPDDNNAKRDIFLKDMQSGALSLVSVSAAGAQGEEDSYSSVSVSADGRWVAFSSDAPNLVPGDTNATSGKTNVFLKDMQTGALSPVSTSSAGIIGQGKSEFASISADGRFVAFDSGAPNLVEGDTNKKSDVFIKDMQSGTTVRISTSTSDTGPGTPVSPG